VRGEFQLPSYSFDTARVSSILGSQISFLPTAPLPFCLKEGVSAWCVEPYADGIVARNRF